MRPLRSSRRDHRRPSQQQRQEQQQQQQPSTESTKGIQFWCWSTMMTLMRGENEEWLVGMEAKKTKKKNTFVKRYGILLFTMSTMMILYFYQSNKLLRPFKDKLLPTGTATSSMMVFFQEVTNTTTTMANITSTTTRKMETKEVSPTSSKENNSPVDLYSVLSNVTIYNTSVLYEGKKSSSSQGETSLLDRYKAKNAPIAWDIIMQQQQQQQKQQRLHRERQQKNNIKKTTKIRVRVLLFLSSYKTITFRGGPTSLIGDEILNLCMDGFERSPYFELLNYTTIPAKIFADGQHQQNFILPEDDDTTWIIDMRRMLSMKGYSIPEQLRDVLTNTMNYYHKAQQEFHVQTDNGTISTGVFSSMNHSTKSTFRNPNIQVVFWDWRDHAVDLCDRGRIDVEEQIIDEEEGYDRGNHDNNQQQTTTMMTKKKTKKKKKTTTTVILRQLEELLDNNPYNIRFCQQQITYGKGWDKQKTFPSKSKVFSNFGHCLTYPTIHMPYVVRSDYVEMVLQLYPKFLPNSTTISTTAVDTTSNASLSSSSFANNDNHPSYTIRPLDVAHFWPYNKKSSLSHGKLRNMVTKTIQTLQNKTITIQQRQLHGHGHGHGQGLYNRYIQHDHEQERQQDEGDSIKFITMKKNISVYTDSVSKAGSTGRTSAQTAYMEAMLTTKIVVVAQRDAWEDHYRYFEAIVGGPLVLTDPMATLPDGYINGTNVIVYRSLQELKHYITYYLEHPMERIAIAKRGWDLAISRHRTYHWMEELFFGRPLTK